MGAKGVKLRPNEYRCDACGEIYEKGWSDEEAEREATKNFGAIIDGDKAIICDDCYKKMFPVKPSIFLSN